MSSFINLEKKENFMRKLILMIAVMFSAITMATAQTVEGSKFFDNTFIGLGGGTTGVISPKYNGFDNFAESMGGVIDLRLGKNVTPIFGVELEGLFHLPSSNANSNTAFDFMNIGVNALFNVNNMIHGYKGQPDKVEFVPFIGGGWQKQFTSYSANDFYTKGGFQVNWNFAKAWQVNFIPSINYRMTNNGTLMVDNFTQPKFNANRAHVTFVVGLTYKFKNSHGTHDFVLSQNKFTQADMDRVNEMLREQNEKNAKNEETILGQSKLISEKNAKIDSLMENTNDTILNEVNVFPVIGFEIGKSEISVTQKASLVQLAEFLNSNEKNVTIIGHSDAKTGSESRNLELSKERAESVKKELIKLGIDENRIETFGKGSTEQLFEENDSNRAVVFVVTE